MTRSKPTSQAAGLLSIVFALLPISLLFTPGGAIQPRQIILGVLEDVPGSYGESNSRKVRVLFQKNGDLGRVTGRTPKAFDLYSHTGLQDVISAGPVPTIGKRSEEFSGFLPDAVYRPLAAVSEPNFKDPELWKPSQPPAAVISLVRQQFRKRFPAVSNCISRTSDTEKPWAYKDENIRVLKSYSSNMHWSVVQVRLGEYRCDGFPDDPFLETWFAVSPGNEITFLDGGIWLVDAGDYDNDGKSELLFSIARYNAGGYELFYDEFKKHVIFQFSYH